MGTFLVSWQKGTHLKQVRPLFVRCADAIHVHVKEGGKSLPLRRTNH
jgi:hypothetical protein